MNLLRERLQPNCIEAYQFGQSAPILHEELETGTTFSIDVLAHGLKENLSTTEISSDILSKFGKQ